MKILVEDISPNGVAVRADLTRPWAAQAAGEVMGAAPTALSVDLLVTRIGRQRVAVAGSLSASAPSQCGRCLSEVVLTLQGDVALRYSTPEEGADVDASTRGEGNALSDKRLDEALDEGWFDGVTLDMGQVVSEQLALWEPPRIRCDVAEVARLDDGVCEPITYDSGPEVKRPSPFAGLAGLKLPK